MVVTRYKFLWFGVINALEMLAMMEDFIQSHHMLDCKEKM